MTQAVAQVRNSVARTGFANPLTLGVLVEDVDQLKVYADSVELQVGVDYSVTGIGDEDGVEIEIIGAEDVNEYVGIESFTALFDPNFDQLTDLSLGGGMGRPFETALDQQNRRLQALASRVDRALKVPVDIEGDQVVNPVPGYALGFDEDGNLVPLAPGGLGFAEAVVATAVSFTPVGSVLSTNVQAALAEMIADLDDATADIVALYLAASDLDTALDGKQPLASQLTALAAVTNPAVQSYLTYSLSASAPAYAPVTDLLPTGAIRGLGTANGADATNDITVSAGVCVDSTGVRVMKLTSALTKQLDATWAAGSAAGGRFAASISNATWHVFLIENPTTGAVDVGFSTNLNPTSDPSYPAGYTYYCRIWSIVRASNAIRAYTQVGDVGVWTAPLLDVDTTNPGTSAVTATLSVPVGIAVIAALVVSAETSSAAGEGLVTPLVATDVAPAANNCNFGFDPDAPARTPSAVAILTNTSGQVRYRVNSSGASMSVKVRTFGWTDTRGRA